MKKERNTGVWPTLPTKILKFRAECDIAVDATVNLNNRCVVAVHWYNNVMDDQEFTPAEAERYAKALIAAAKCCREKQTRSKS
jgi:hypothetical protein